jgi:hypothetical protein
LKSPFELALRGRRTNNFVKLLCLVASGGVGICVSSTSLKKSNIGWPQQPQTEKVLTFKMVFCDSTPNSIFSKHQNKAKIKNLDDSEVLIYDFPDIRTSAASMTSSASAASMASTISEALFYQKTS